MSYLDHDFVPADEMRLPRQRRLVRAGITDSFGTNHDIVIRNVSEKGLGATMRGVPPLRGTAVTVLIPQGMTMNGTIRWVDGAVFGIEFDSPIELQTLADLIQRNHETAKCESQWEVANLHQVHSGHFDPTKVRKI